MVLRPALWSVAACIAVGGFQSGVFAQGAAIRGGPKISNLATPLFVKSTSAKCHESQQVIDRDGQQIFNGENGTAIFRLSPSLIGKKPEALHGTIKIKNGAGWYVPGQNFYGIEQISFANGERISIFVGPPAGRGLRDIIGVRQSPSRESIGVRSIGTTIEYFNSADDAPLQESFAHNQNLRAIETLEFNHFTPANAFKWPQMGWVDAENPYVWHYDWSKADKIAQEIRARNSKINLHALVWDSQNGIPQHLRNMHKDGVLTPRLMRREIRSHIHTLIERYGDIADRIDVVNEDVYKETEEYLFGQKKYLGDGYIAFAFKETRKAIKAYNRDHGTSIAPQLILNDFNVLFSLTDSEGDNKSDEFYKLLSRLLKQGVKIDVVGMQAHIRVDEMARALDRDKNGLSGEEIYAGIRDNLKRFSDLGVSIMISELDVEESYGEADAKGDSDFTLYYEVIGALVHDLPALTDLSLWGSSDATMRMVRDGFEDDPGIYDKNYQRKPEYFALLQGLTGNSQFSRNPKSDGANKTEQPAASCWY